MDAKNQVILLHKQKEMLLAHKSKTSSPLALIPSFLCIQNSCDLKEENPLLKAYQDKLLSQNQNYLSFYFPLKFQNNLLCFFAPHSLLASSKFAMLDLILPTQITHKELCVLFVYPSNALFCFYQNQTLQYCKNISYHPKDIHLCQHSLKTLFDCNSPLYALSYLNPIPQVLHSLNLTPFSSLFTSSPPDYALHFEKISIIQEKGIIPLTSPPSHSLKLLKFMLLSFSFFVSITAIFCFFIHSPPPIQNNDTRSLQILSTLQATPSNKPLFLLLQTLNNTLKDAPLLHIQFSNSHLILEFKKRIPKNLPSLLSSYGYTQKVLNPTTLEIAL